MPPENFINPFLKLKVRNLFLRGLLLSIGFGIALGFLQGISGVKFDTQIVTLILYILIFGFLSIWAIQDFDRFGIDMKYVVGQVPSKYKWLPIFGLVLLIILFSLSAYLVSFYLLSLAAPTFVENVMRQVASKPAPGTTSSPFYNILSAIVYIIIAPITEEFLFRGFILPCWASKWGIQTAVVVSGLLFGMLHANVLGLTLFGIIMGVLYIKTRTLIVPIACHAFNNLLAVGIGLLSSSSETTTSTVNVLEELRSNWWVGVVLMLISLPLLVRFLYRNWPRKDTLIPYFINSEQN
jgi:uncharacterized protein